MKYLDLLTIALKHLRSRLFETVVIIVAIALGTGVIAMALSLRLGYLEEMKEVDRRGLNKNIFISSRNTYLGEERIKKLDDEIAEPAEFTLSILDDIRENCPDVDYIFTSRIRSFNLSEQDPDKKVSFNERMDRFSVKQTTVDEFVFRELKLKKGHYFTNQDIKQGNKVILLRDRAARELFPDGNPIGKEIELYRRRREIPFTFTVIGVLKPYEDYIVSNRLSFEDAFIPYTINIYDSEIHKTPEELVINSFTAGVKSTEQLMTAKRQIDSYLSSNIQGVYDIELPDTEDDSVRDQLIMSFLASLGLLIAAINILNLMMGRVLRRTKEVGIIKAIGSSRKNISYIFLSEVLLMGLAGALLGLIVTYGGRLIINTYIEAISTELKINYQIILFSIGIAGFISLLFGVYPALEAAQIDPVDALRTE